MLPKFLLALTVSFFAYAESAHAVKLVCSNSMYENIFSGRSDLPATDWSFIGQHGQVDCDDETGHSYRVTFTGLSNQAGYSSSGLLIACSGRDPVGRYAFAGASCSFGVGCTLKFSVKSSVSDPSACIITGMKFGVESPGFNGGVMKIERL